MSREKRRGKIMGGLLGLVTGGPIGAVLGLVIGHMYDKDVLQPWAALLGAGGFSGNSQQTNFTTGVIVLGAKMAKADGRVTRAEVEAFKRVFRITPQQEDSVGKLFNRARTSASGFEPYAFQLAQTFRDNRVVLEEILGGLFIIASADSAGLSPAEIRFLQSVATIFDFAVPDFMRIAARAGVTLPGGGSSGASSGAGAEPQKPVDANANAYEILGVSVAATPQEIKQAYRALIREHHPDRLMAQGLPPEFVATASEKMKRINVAYDVVCKARGIK